MWIRRRRLPWILGVALILLGCREARRPAESTTAARRAKAAPPVPAQTPAQPRPQETDQPIMARTRAPQPEPVAPNRDGDLVSLAQIDPTILIEITFAQKNNPFHYQFFKTNEAFARYGTAKKLAAVQRDLRARDLGLKIWSAYRPFAVQVKMFQIVGGNRDWVSDPYHDSGKKAHVRGVAVDATLVDKSGRELAMPTPYLDFRRGAEKMKQSYRNLPAEVLANRKLLLSVMTAHGMEPYVGEWWHYQDEDWVRYPVIAVGDFPEIHRRILVEDMLRLKTDPP